MKKIEYQNEVASFRLSEQFKEELKAKMLEEYNKTLESPAPVEETPKIEMSGAAKFGKKYSRYAAIAACLLLVISTVSVITVKGLKTGKPVEDDLKTEDNITTDTAITDDRLPSTEDFDEETEEALDDAAPEETPENEYDDVPIEEIDADIDDEVIPDTHPATDYNPEDDSKSKDDAEQKYSRYASPEYSGDYNGDNYVNSSIGSSEGLPEASVDPERIITYPQRILGWTEVEEEEHLADTPTSLPAPAPPSDNPTTRPSNGSETTNDDRETPVEAPEYDEEIEEALPPVYDNVEEPSEAPAPSYGSGVSGSAPSGVGSWMPGMNNGAIPNPEPTDAAEPTEEVDYEEEAALEEEESVEFDFDATVDVEAEVESQIYDDVNPCTDDPAADVYSSYADFRNKSLKGVMMKTSLVRFAVERVYTEDDLMFAAPGVSIDPFAQTLYKINVSYDYFNDTAADVDMLMINDGSYNVQVDGCPVMDGEYIARIVMNDDGVVYADTNILYKVYSVNGLDIAYHLQSTNNANVDPGDTNMGLLPEESSVYTTTANNPEKYVHKAAVSELTEYLTSDLLALDPVILDLESGYPVPHEHITATYSENALHVNIDDEEVFPDPDGIVKEILEAMGAVIGDKTCTVITKDGNKAIFEKGELTGLDITSDTPPLAVDVNGVRVGYVLNGSLSRLKINGYHMMQNSEVTLKASEKNGGWTVTLVYTDNVLTEIIVKK